MRNFRRFSVSIAVLLMLTGSCVCVQAQTDAEKSGGAPTAKVDSGKRAFTSAGCIACHGAQGQGTKLAPQIAPPPLELPALIGYVRQPSGTMPAVSAATASDQQLSDIYAFLKSAAPASQGGPGGQRRERQKAFPRLWVLSMPRVRGTGRFHGPAHRPAATFAGVSAELRPRSHRTDAALH